MKNYEIDIIVSPDLSEEEAKLTKEKVSSFILEAGGTLTEAKDPLRTRTGYAIAKKREAYLVEFSFTLEPEKLKDLQTRIKEEKQILRFMVLNKKIEKEPPAERRPRPILTESAAEEEAPRETVKNEKKVELEEIEEKLEEILKP